MTNRYANIEMGFYSCSFVTPRENPSFILTVLKELDSFEVVFYELRAGQPDREIGIDDAFVEASSTLLFMAHFDHPILRLGTLDLLDKNRSCATLKIGVSTNSFTVRDKYKINYADPKNECFIDALAFTRIAACKLLVPKFHPKIVLVDDWFGVPVNDKALEECTLKKLFWSIYFGPQYTEKYGREWLLSIPAWKTEEFEGGVIVTVTENYHKFISMKHLDTLTYLRQKFKGMKVNKFDMGNF